MTDEQFRRLMAELQKQTRLLERIATQKVTEAPNYTYGLDNFLAFDWSVIGAEVANTDADGVAAVRWQGHIYLRRSAQNKFKPAIWFSRSLGKDGDGTNKYERLITFKANQDAERLPTQVKRGVCRPLNASCELSGRCVRHTEPAPQ